jgi:hypothetical protein
MAEAASKSAPVAAPVSSEESSLVPASGGDEESSLIPLGAAQKNPLQMGVPYSPGKSPTGSDLNNIWDKTIDFIRPWVGQASGSMLGALATPGGPAAVLGGDVAGYGATDLALQSLKTGDFNLQEGLSEASKEALINAVGGRIVNGVVAGARTMRNANLPDIYSLFPTTSQALEHLGWKNLSTIPKALEDLGAYKTKQAALDKSGGAGFSQWLDTANRLTGKDRLSLQDPTYLKDQVIDKLKQGFNANAQPGSFQTNLHYATQDVMNAVNGGDDAFQVLRDTIHDDKKLDKVLSVGQSVGPASLNVRQDLQAFHFMDMLNHSTSQKVRMPDGSYTARIDPEAIKKEWFNPANEKMLDKLYGAGDKKDIDAFLTRIMQTQDNPMAGGLGKWTGKGIMLGGAAGGLGTLLGAHVPVAASALYIPANLLGRAFTKTGVAKAMAGAVGAVPTSGYKETARTILSGLQGMRIALTDNGGNKHWGTVSQGRDGNFDWNGEATLPQPGNQLAPPGFQQGQGR